MDVCNNNETWIEMPCLKDNKPILRIVIPPYVQEKYEDEYDTISDEEDESFYDYDHEEDAPDYCTITRDYKEFKKQSEPDEYTKLYKISVCDWLEKHDVNWKEKTIVTENWFTLKISFPKAIYIAFVENPLMYRKFLSIANTSYGFKSIQIVYY